MPGTLKSSFLEKRKELDIPREFPSFFDCQNELVIQPISSLKVIRDSLEMLMVSWMKNWAIDITVDTDSADFSGSSGWNRGLVNYCSSIKISKDLKLLAVQTSLFEVEKLLIRGIRGVACN
jgi:hypothetical protein